MWERVRALIDAKDPDGVAALVVTLSDHERPEVAKALPGHLTAIRERGGDSWAVEEYGAELRAAGVGVLGGAAAIATWLNRRGLQPGWRSGDDSGRLAWILRHRPAELRADLGRRMALKLRGRRDRDAALALALLRESGEEPPLHGPLVLAWVTDAGRADRADPLLPALLPQIFEADGVGRLLREDHHDVRSWQVMLAGMARDGDVDRRFLLDGCVTRFLRGGADTDLRFFVRLHDLLEPSDDEIRPRLLDYVRLLPAAPGPVASLALRHLRALGGLPPEHVAECVEALLFRPEAALVRAGLSWLDRCVRHDPSLIGSLASAFHSTSREVQERAVRIALKHAPLMTAESRAALADAVPLLPPDLAVRLAGTFGGEVPEEEADGFVPGELPGVPPDKGVSPREFTRGELINALRRYPSGRVAVERLMAGLVTLAHRDRPGVRAALERSLGQATKPWQSRPWAQAYDWLCAAGHVIAGTATWDWSRRMPPADLVAPPQLMLLHRCAEILAAVERDEIPPVLLATPTRASGHVDAGVLVSRMEEHEAAGVKPLSADLQQALLRLPRTPDPEAAERAGRLTSAAGGIVAAWLAGTARPEPQVSVRWAARVGSSGESTWLDDKEPDVDFHYVKPVVTSRAPRTGLPLIDLLLNRDPGGFHGDRDQLSALPAVLPSHREVAAAHLVPFLPASWDRATAAAEEVARAVTGEGPAGEAVALALAYRLAENGDAYGGRAEDERRILPAIWALTARGELPAAEMGRQIGFLVTRKGLKLGRFLPALERTAQRGAHAEVFTMIVSAIPALASARRLPHRLDALLVLARRIAVGTGIRGAFPEIAALAARTGRSAAVREARRLHEFVSSTGSDMRGVSA
ncbi:hypothetical protein D5H75_10195 [Bailinhaonella thermotolerans]|uniref:DUF7824 domain-containing protein n=1 Tax=Bailinhaonella thermotolerans TaxID=1070861 RepID=A0A3A4B556_9ACTN|nr:hypothetical protein D5H75_10195 [Bailinhaonella thermotolerans]